MSDIFISYAREDKDKAKLLAEAFSQQGWSVWWDRQIPPGKSFDETIEAALNAARCVIVLWSKESVLSRWVKTEAAEGAQRGILVPILVEQVPIPLEFKRIEAADLSDWRIGSSHPEFDEVLKIVAHMVSDQTFPKQKPPHTKISLGNWWKTVPGLFIGTAGVITAVIGLGFALHQIGLVGNRDGTAPAKAAQSIPARKARDSSTGSLVVSEEEEPNDQITESNVVEVGTRIRGKMSDEDRDFYRFETSPGASERTRVLLRKLTSAGFWADVSIYDQAEKLVEHGSERGDTPVSLAFDSKPNASYYVTVKSLYGQRKGAYELEMREE